MGGSSVHLFLTLMSAQLRACIEIQSGPSLSAFNTSMWYEGDSTWLLVCVGARAAGARSQRFDTFASQKRYSAVESLQPSDTYDLHGL